MTAFDAVLGEIDRGRKGLNRGLPMGLPKLESITDGITKSTYTLIISSSGSGKTSFCLYSYVYRPLMEHLDDGKFKVLYVSLEMSATAVMTKLLSLYMFERFGKVLSYRDILSRRRDRLLSDADYADVLKCREWMNKVSEHIEFYDKKVSADALYAVICKRLEKAGKFEETETRKTWTPDDPGVTRLVVVDHIALLRQREGRTLKQEMDLASAYLLTLREMCGISPVVVQQANREHASGARIQAGRTNFMMSDAKDSGNMANDANVMLAVYDPAKDGSKTYRGYPVDALGGRFRTVTVLKNRFGECDVEVPLVFYGEINKFAELARPEQIDGWEKYTGPGWMLEKLL